MNRKIILDTETTGLKTEEGHRVIEIGALEVIDDKLTGLQFHSFVDPEREIDEGATNIHGITKDMLIGKPKFHEIVTRLMKFIQGRELIIHNAQFDIGHLDNEISLLPESTKENIQSSYRSLSEICKVTCTLQIARRKYPYKKNSLDALCERLDIDKSKRTMHGALVDCMLLWEVYRKLVSVS